MRHTPVLIKTLYIRWFDYITVYYRWDAAVKQAVSFSVNYAYYIILLGYIVSLFSSYTRNDVKTTHGYSNVRWQHAQRL